MYIQPDQLHEILSPKRNCQRGLEEYIVNVHQGDKQKSHSKKGTGYSSTKKGKPDGYNVYYGYINNPVYRVGEEGNPGSLSYSSRHLTEANNTTTVLNPNESELHLLTNAIDSRSVLLPPVKWNQNWGYDRGDIPNQLTTTNEIFNQKEFLREYDDEVDLGYIQYQADGIANRYLPIYNRAHISTDEEPDGIHDHPTHDRYYGIGKRIVLPTGNSNMKIIEGIEGPTVEWMANNSGDNKKPIKEIGDIKNYVEESVESFGIENYQNVKLNNHKNQHKTLGKYGNPVPDAYGRLGGSLNRYEVLRNSSFNGVNTSSYLIPDTYRGLSTNINEGYQTVVNHHREFNKRPITVQTKFRGPSLHPTTNSQYYLMLWVTIGIVSVMVLGIAQKSS